jgi:hypothetical protein
MNAASLVGRVSILFWTCQVLTGDDGFFQGMFQSVTGIPTIDSHFVRISLTKCLKGIMVPSEVHSNA